MKFSPREWILVWATAAVALGGVTYALAAARMGDWRELRRARTQLEQRQFWSFKHVSALKRLAVSYASQIPDYAEAKQRLSLPEPRAPRKKRKAEEDE